MIASGDKACSRGILDWDDVVDRYWNGLLCNNLSAVGCQIGPGSPKRAKTNKARAMGELAVVGSDGNPNKNKQSAELLAVGDRGQGL